MNKKLILKIPSIVKSDFYYELPSYEMLHQYMLEQYNAIPVGKDHWEQNFKFKTLEDKMKFILIWT